MLGRPRSPPSSARTANVSVFLVVVWLLLPMSEPRGRLWNSVDRSLKAVRELATQGYTIVTVCDRQTALDHASQVWDDLEALGTGICRDDEDTCNNERWPQTTHGLLQNQSAGLWHGVCGARLATEPAFTRLFGGKRAIFSFDAAAVIRPTSQERTFKREKKNQISKGEKVLLASWCHTDQAKAKQQCMEHIQGAFALTDLGPAEQRTQLVIPPEGTTIQDFRDAFIAAHPAKKVSKGFDPEREEWVKHDDDERQWLIEHGRVITPTLEAGQMLLWDSGVPHASIPGPLLQHTFLRNFRMSVFVSALPLEVIDADDLAVRREMLEEADTSGHRVTAPGKRKGKYRKCKFAKTGRTYGKSLPTYKNTRVVTGFKSAIAKGEDSVAAKMARICGGY